MAEFHSGRLFKRGIATFSEAERGYYLDLYNIIAVVAFHPAAVRRVSRTHCPLPTS